MRTAALEWSARPAYDARQVAFRRALQGPHHGPWHGWLRLIAAALQQPPGPSWTRRTTGYLGETHMRELRLIGVHDDGEHLLLTEDGDDRFTVSIDEALRSAVRRAMPVPSADVDSVPVPDELRPRDVQALLRAGASVSDVAERAGWPADKVRRYEGPIRAERDHIAGLARAIAVSGGAAGRADSTFGERAERRLDGRGVESDAVVWDSWRGRDGDWAVLCSFPAGGRPRRATWHFDVRSRTLEPTDDEARWLGEDEGSPGPLAAAREPSVYDVEAEGGLNAAHAPKVRRVRGGRTSATAVPEQPAAKTKPTSGSAAKDPAETGERPVDLVAAMRERSKNRRRKGRSAAQQDFPEDAAPREQLDTTADAPPVGSHPREGEITETESDQDAATDPGTKPSVDQLGHDPVTGTADLFADLPADAATTTVEEHTQPSAEEDESPEPRETAATSEHADAPAPETDSAEQPNSSRPQAVSADSGTDVPDRPSSARKGRPSVPSWDDIMFGRRPGRD